MSETTNITQAENSKTEKNTSKSPLKMIIAIVILLVVLIGIGIFSGMQANTIKNLNNTIENLNASLHEATHKTEIYVYNNTDEPITFKLNETEYTTKRRHELITLAYGEYDLSINGKIVDTFTISEKSRHAILNVGKADFMKEIFTYKISEETDTSHVLRENIVTIDKNTTYIGPYVLIRGKYFLEKEWDFHPWEFPSHMHFAMQNEYSIASELWDLETFMSNRYSEEELAELSDEE